MLTITLFNFVGGELEGAYQASELAETNVVSGAAKAYLGPSIGRFVPYAGLGAGAYRESLPGRSDQGTYGLVFVGAKLKFPFGLVVRGEYQWLTLPSDVLAAARQPVPVRGRPELLRPRPPRGQVYTSSRPWSS